MSNFNWQTDDDVNWDDLEPAAETAVPRRHPWITYALIVVGVITAVTLIYRQINQRIETATANATGDILASHNLVQQASATQDVELFNTLLSGVDDGWVEAQSDLIQQYGLFDRSAFDLLRLSADTAVTQADIDNGTINIELNPELNAAELTFPQAYVVNVGNGVTETVQLQQTAVYRQGTQRWLYAPPDDEFWGAFETVTGSMLSLAYPARDAELALRLSFDLDAKLAEMCRSLADLNCPDDFRLSLRLDNDPQSFLDAAQSGYALGGGSMLTLPTPTLVGLPVDEAGYQGLYRGYAIQLVSTAVAELTGYECCDHLAYFQALLDYQLDELGLRPLALDRVDYERVVRENIAFENLDDGWRSPDNLSSREDGWLVITAVDFLRRQLPNDSIASLQREMDRNPLFTNWLGAITAESTEFNRYSLISRWQSFAFEQYQAEQGPPPWPLPAQDIYLLCSPQQEEAISELYQYKLADSEWIQHPLDASALSMNPLPDNGSFLLQDFGEEMRTFLWQNGQNQPLFENGMITFGQFDPTGHYLLVYGVGQESPDINRIDWTACAAGDCAVELLGGNPVWSPQGTDFIVLPAESLGQEPFVVNGRTILFYPTNTPAEWPLYRGDGQPPMASLDALTYLGVGYAPFWLDETRFGYIRQIPLSSDSRRHEMVIVDMADMADSLLAENIMPQPVLTERDLLLALPEEESPVSLVMRYVVGHPQQPDLLFIGAVVEDRQMYIFSKNMTTGTLEFHLKTGINDTHSLGFSPDGRYLVVTGSGAGPQLFANQRNNVYFYDLLTNQSQTFAGANEHFLPSNIYDWSADGHWVVVTQENQMMTLIAPAFGYQQFIPHNLGECGNVAWLNQ